MRSDIIFPIDFSIHIFTFSAEAPWAWKVSFFLAFTTFLGRDLVVQKGNGKKCFLARCAACKVVIFLFWFLLRKKETLQRLQICIEGKKSNISVFQLKYSLFVLKLFSQSLWREKWLRFFFHVLVSWQFWRIFFDWEFYSRIMNTLGSELFISTSTILSEKLVY